MILTATNIEREHIWISVRDRDIAGVTLVLEDVHQAECLTICDTLTQFKCASAELYHHGVRTECHLSEFTMSEPHVDFSYYAGRDYFEKYTLG